jgi:hypothetical protein
MLSIDSQLRLETRLVVYMNASMRKSSARSYAMIIAVLVLESEADAILRKRPLK